MSLQTNLAVVVSTDPLSRTVKDRGVPNPGPEEILVRVEAAGLNPVDPRIGTMYIAMWPEFPTVPGAEAAGIVVALGSEVKGFKIGDRVPPPLIPPSSSDSSISLRNPRFVQWVLTPCDAPQGHLASLPPNISLEEGASIPVGLFTSLHALYAQPPDGAGLVSPVSPGGRGKYAGQPIVILGGAGATGHYALQLARLSGFSPIITTASLKNESLLKSLGATHVIDRSLPDADVVKAISALAPTLSLVFDSISTKDTLALGFAILKDSKKYSNGKKTLVQIIIIPIPEAASEGIDVYMGWASSAWPQNNALSRELYAQLEGLLADGTIKPMKVEVVKGGLDMSVLEEAWKGIDKVSAVKRVVLPQETHV
ncbi:chaperonin 10-like protein [Mycena polygramma]|nr:chaperonin 10-like protein [Mycena polygramma]